MARCAVAVAMAVTIAACGGDDDTHLTSARFDVADGAGFFDAPFPIASRMRPDGSLVVNDFPIPPGGNGPSELALAELESTPVGFGVTAGVFIPFDGPLDPASLPARETVGVDGPVFLVDVEPSSRMLDQRVPVWVQLRTDEQTSSPADLLVVLPRPGLVLRRDTMYAAVVLDDVRAADGAELGVPEELTGLLAGESTDAPPPLQTAFGLLSAHLERAGIDPARVRAATVYRTGDPLSPLVAVRDAVHAMPAPTATDLAPLVEHGEYCAVTGNIEVPLFQDGVRPFTEAGGGFRFGADGAPIVQATETIRFVVTIPKATMPPDGWPLLFYSAGQGGAYTQVVDRGTSAEQMAGTPGVGPARWLALSGIAAMSIEAPLVGPRHPDGDTSGLEFFNPTNPVAFRDTARQAATDFFSLVRLARSLALDPALCPGADAGGASFGFDATRFFFHGHSTGATAGAMVLGVEDDVAAGVLSGFGGSWLYNLTIKEQPFRIADVVRVILGYRAGDQPDLYDPILNLLQTLWEGSEPMVWAERWARDSGAPKDVLLVEGVIDGFFPPPAVNAAAIAARAAPVGPTVEDTLAEDVSLVGLSALPAPTSANLDTPTGAATSAVVQYEPPAGIDGHYVTFELDSVKHQYRCFFETRARDGVATVVAAAADLLAPCE